MAGSWAVELRLKPAVYPCVLICPVSKGQEAVENRFHNLRASLWDWHGESQLRLKENVEKH